MKTIISDASPIIALDNIGQLEILKLVYDKIYVTEIVKNEIGIDLPDWFIVNNEYEKDTFEALSFGLDAGEASAIALAIKHNRDEVLLIIDERKGRKIAKGFGLNIIGLLGVIIKAKLENKIAAGMPLINRLVKNGFRISDSILEIVRKKLNE